MTRPSFRLAAVAAAAATLVAGGVALAPAARADTPQQQAAHLAAQVQDLQHQTEQATEAYDAAKGRLAEVVTAKFAADRALTAALQAAKAQDQVNGSTLRDVYEMGGPAALYATALTAGTDPAAVPANLDAIGRVVAAGKVRSADLASRSAAAVTAKDAADALAHQQADLEAQVAAHATAIEADLQRTQALLDTANAEVRALEQQAEAAREAADHAQFLQALAMSSNGSAGTAQYAQYASQLAGVVPPASPIAAAALQNAMNLQGHPYQWGGTGPVGYDCSGMTGAAYAAAGLRLPRTAAQQYQAGPHVPLSGLQPGDLLFWASDPSNPATIEHVAMYAGNGLMVSANHTGDTVRLQPVWWKGFAGATRPNAVAAAAVPGPVWAAGQTA